MEALREGVASMAVLVKEGRAAALQPPTSTVGLLQRLQPGYVPGPLHVAMGRSLDAALEGGCRWCLEPEEAHSTEALPDKGAVSGSAKEKDSCPGYERLRKLMISCPPQHGKSTLISVGAPAKFLGDNPERYWVAASYSASLARRNGRFARQFVQQADYERTYGIRLSKESSSASEWEIEGRRGGFFGVGIGGGLTGRTADVAVIDDPVRDRQAADSKVIRDSTWDWYTSVLSTRLNEGSVQIIVMTRWNYDDLVGRLLVEEGDQATGGEWRVENYPAIAEAKDLLGRDEGEPLPTGPRGVEWDTERALAFYDERRKLGTRDWAALYQQRPTVDGGNVFVEDWFDYYDPEEDSPPYEFTIQATDTAYTEKKENDRSADLVGGVYRRKVYLLDCWADRVQFPALKRILKNRHLKYMPTHHRVEATAAGYPVVQEIQEDVDVQPWTPKGDKISRAYAVQGMVEARRVLLPRFSDGTHPPWVRPFLEEVCRFPMADHDDQVDALTMLLHILRELETMRNRIEPILREEYAGDDDRYRDTDTGKRVLLDER